MEPVTVASIWCTAALTALVPLAFVIAPVMMELLSHRRRRHGTVSASRGTPRA